MFNSIVKKDIDLLQAYYHKDTPSSSERIVKLLAFPVSVIVVFAALFGWQFMGTLSYQSDIDKMHQETKKYNQKISDIGGDDYKKFVSYRDRNESVVQIMEVLRSYPNVNGDVINTITQSMFAGMSVQTFGFDNGKIIASLQTQYVLDIEKYVANLRASGVFESVGYTGYQLSSVVVAEASPENEEQALTQNVYNFQIICSLKGGE